MSKPIKTVAVVGAGGNLGIYVVRHLLNAGFTVTVISRQSSKYKPPSSEVKVIRLPDSYPVDELERAFKGQDAVVGTVVPITGDDFRFRMVDAAARAGVRRLIPADFGMDINPGSLRILPALQERLDVQEHYKSKESDTFSWTSVTTGLFYDFGLGNSSLFLVNIKARKAQILEGGKVPFSACTCPTIADSIVKILQKLSETKNKVLMIQSFSTTQEEVISSVEKALGERIEITGRVSQAEFLAESDKKIDEGNAGAGLLDKIICLGMLDSDFQSNPQFANELLGLKTLDVEEETRKALSGDTLKQWNR